MRLGKRSIRDALLLAALSVSMAAGFACYRRAMAPEELRCAAFSGDLSRVQELLAQGVSPRSKGQWGTTALILAASNGHTSIIRALLDAGAEIDDRGRGEQTALMLASENGHYGTVKYLLERNADRQLRDI